MARHQQVRRLFAAGQARADQAEGARQRQVALGQVLAQRTALVVGQQWRQAGAETVADQAQRLALEQAQGGQFDQFAAVGQLQVCLLYTSRCV